jgi:hypothetical protein
VEGLSVLTNGMAKQWYKLHVSSCHGSWVILIDRFCFTFFPLSKIINLHNEVLNFSQKEGESLGTAWSRYNQLALLGPELSILDAMFMQLLWTGWVQNLLNTGSNFWGSLCSLHG